MRPTRVVLDDEAAEGLPVMLHGLLAAAAEQPEKQSLLDRMSGTVTVSLPDADVAVGLRFAAGAVTVYARALPGSTVTFTMPSGTLLGLPTVPLLLGLPSPLAPEGRDFLRRVATRDVRIRGAHHVRLIAQLTTLLSLT